MITAWSKINDLQYDKIICAISGGSDSDVMMDICFKCDKDNKIDYVWYDTGLEYQATKEHLKYLEDKYGVEIKRLRAIKPIPLSVKDYGVPFISKYVSEMIMRLQTHNFTFTDEPFDILYNKYPKCKTALNWWCNMSGIDSHFTVYRNAWLKEFIMQNPPTFKISNKCCKYAKKDPAHKFIVDNDYQMNIIGVRKSEGGVRSTGYKNCFSKVESGCDEYRPLFFFTDNDKKDYENTCNIIHSRCYTDYGLVRTGCVGCPYGKDFENELNILQEHEPKLFIAANNIFADAYEYTRQYKNFCKEMNEKYGNYRKYLLTIM